MVTQRYPCTNSQDNFPYLTSKAVPSPEKMRSAQHDMLFTCCVVEPGYSTHLPHPERMRPKTRLSSPRSEQPLKKSTVKKQAAKMVVTYHSLISASAKVCAGTPNCTSGVPRGAMHTGNPAFQETGHIMVPPHYMQSFHGAVQRQWAPPSCTKLYVTSRQTTFSHLSNKFQSELVN